MGAGDGNPATEAVLQQADGSWVAPYGSYHDLDQGLQSERTAAELAKLQKDISQSKEREREELERVKGKVWRDHQHADSLQREVDRLRSRLKQLTFEWRNGPWPRGPQGPPGPGGTNGAVGPPGPPGSLSARALRQALAHDLTPTRVAAAASAALRVAETQITSQVATPPGCLPALRAYPFEIASLCSPDASTSPRPRACPHSWHRQRAPSLPVPINRLATPNVNVRLTRMETCTAWKRVHHGNVRVPRLAAPEVTVGVCTPGVQAAGR